MKKVISEQRKSPVEKSANISPAVKKVEPSAGSRYQSAEDLSSSMTASSSESFIASMTMDRASTKAKSSHTTSSTAYSARDTEPSKTAQERFGSRKGISSDMYFQGENDAATAFERRDKVQKFAGSASISSDMYYGRDTGMHSGTRGKSDSIGDAAEFMASAAADAREVASNAAESISNMFSRMRS